MIGAMGLIVVIVFLAISFGCFALTAIVARRIENATTGVVVGALAGMGASIVISIVFSIIFASLGAGY